MQEIKLIREHEWRRFETVLAWCGGLTRIGNNESVSWCQLPEKVLLVDVFLTSLEDSCSVFRKPREVNFENEHLLS